jgi:hypothetical protein
MAKKRFNFGDTTDSAKKALELLKPRRNPLNPRDVELSKRDRAELSEFSEWASKAIFDEQWRRLQVIADQYGTDLASQSGSWTLALLLAIDFVPGFSPFAGMHKGRARTAARDHLDLATEVKSLIKEKNCSASNACEILSKRKGKWKGEKPASLEATYYRFIDAVKREREEIDAAVETMKGDLARQKAAEAARPRGGNSLNELLLGLSQDDATE